MVFLKWPKQQTFLSQVTSIYVVRHQPGDICTCSRIKRLVQTTVVSQRRDSYIGLTELMVLVYDMHNFVH